MCAAGCDICARASVTGAPHCLCCVQMLDDVEQGTVIPFLVDNQRDAAFTCAAAVELEACDVRVVIESSHAVPVRLRRALQDAAGLRDALQGYCRGADGGVAAARAVLQTLYTSALPEEEANDLHQFGVERSALAELLRLVTSSATLVRACSCLLVCAPFVLQTSLQQLPSMASIIQALRALIRPFDWALPYATVFPRLAAASADAAEQSRAMLTDSPLCHMAVVVQQPATAEHNLLTPGVRSEVCILSCTGAPEDSVLHIGKYAALSSGAIVADLDFAREDIERLCMAIDAARTASHSEQEACYTSLLREFQGMMRSLLPGAPVLAVTPFTKAVVNSPLAAAWAEAEDVRQRNSGGYLPDLEADVLALATGCLRVTTSVYQIAASEPHTAVSNASWWVASRHFMLPSYCPALEHYNAAFSDALTPPPGGGGGAIRAGFFERGASGGMPASVVVAFVPGPSTADWCQDMRSLRTGEELRGLAAFPFDSLVERLNLGESVLLCGHSTGGAFAAHLISRILRAPELSLDPAVRRKLRCIALGTPMSPALQRAMSREPGAAAHVMFVTSCNDALSLDAMAASPNVHSELRDAAAPEVGDMLRTLSPCISSSQPVGGRDALQVLDASSRTPDVQNVLRAVILTASQQHVTDFIIRAVGEARARGSERSCGNVLLLAPTRIYQATSVQQALLQLKAVRSTLADGEVVVTAQTAMDAHSLTAAEQGMRAAGVFRVSRTVAGAADVVGVPQRSKWMPPCSLHPTLNIGVTGSRSAAWLRPCRADATEADIVVQLYGSALDMLTSAQARARDAVGDFKTMTLLSRHGSSTATYHVQLPSALFQLTGHAAVRSLDVRVFSVFDQHEGGFVTVPLCEDNSPGSRRAFCPPDALFFAAFVMIARHAALVPEPPETAATQPPRLLMQIQDSLQLLVRCIPQLSVARAGGERLLLARLLTTCIMFGSDSTRNAATAVITRLADDGCLAIETAVNRLLQAARDGGDRLRRAAEQVDTVRTARDVDILRGAVGEELDLIPLPPGDVLQWQPLKPAAARVDDADGAVAAAAAVRALMLVLAARASVTLWTLLLMDTITVRPFSLWLLGAAAVPLVGLFFVPVIGQVALAVLAGGAAVTIAIAGAATITSLFVHLSHKLSTGYNDRVRQLRRLLRDGVDELNVEAAEQALDRALAAQIRHFLHEPELVSDDSPSSATERRRIVESCNFTANWNTDAHVPLAQTLVLIHTLRMLRTTVFDAALVPVIGLQDAGKTTLSLSVSGRSDVLFPGATNTRVPTLVRTELRHTNGTRRFVTLADMPAVNDSSGVGGSLALQLLPVSMGVVVVMQLLQANTQMAGDLLRILAASAMLPRHVLILLTGVDHFLHNAMHSIEVSNALHPGGHVQVVDPLAVDTAEQHVAVDESHSAAVDRAARALLERLQGARTNLLPLLPPHVDVTLVPVIFNGRAYTPVPVTPLSTIQKVDMEAARRQTDAVVSVAGDPARVIHGGPLSLLKWLQYVRSRWFTEAE